MKLTGEIYGCSNKWYRRNDVAPRRADARDPRENPPGPISRYTASVSLRFRSASLILAFSPGLFAGAASTTIIRDCSRGDCRATRHRELDCRFRSVSRRSHCRFPDSPHRCDVTAADYDVNRILLDPVIPRYLAVESFPESRDSSRGRSRGSFGAVEIPARRSVVRNDRGSFARIILLFAFSQEIGRSLERCWGMRIRMAW